MFADGGPEAWNNDWTAFNGTYRYGPTSTITITTDTQYTTAKRDNNYSYYFTGDGSDYLFTFNLDNLTFSLQRLEVQPTIIRGDVNDDHDVTIADVSALIDYLLTGDVTPFNEANADVNQKNGITIADVSALIDMLLDM